MVWFSREPYGIEGNGNILPEKVGGYQYSWLRVFLIPCHLISLGGSEVRSYLSQSGDCTGFPQMRRVLTKSSHPDI
jgi:hypothetical protein